jgi:hypothetical protein
MAAKRKKKVNPEVLWEQDEILISLKERYFKLLPNENIGKTPKLTSTLDSIEEAINNRKKEIADANS